MKFFNEDIENDKHPVGCIPHALCLMTNHGHDLSKVEKQHQYSEHMRRVHCRYGMYFNRAMGRSGKVAEDRPKTIQVSEDEHLMLCTFYIHANPVKAKMVGDARDYYWSTHKLYAFGKREDWMRNIVLPDWYMKLAPTAELRQRRYRRRFYHYLRSVALLPPNFVGPLFFGPATWCDEHLAKVIDWRAAHRPAKGPPGGKRPPLSLVPPAPRESGPAYS